MSNLIGQILPIAIGIAISPFAIINLILILGGKGARTNGLRFLIGWIGGLAVVAVVVMALANVGRITGPQASKTGGSIVQLVIGIVLLGLS